MYRILVLDGDHRIRILLQHFPWRHCSFEMPEQISKGRDAMQRLKKSPAFDIIMMDIRLPDMNGREFLTSLLSHPAPPCIILMSSWNDFEYAQQSIGLGVFDYLAKPFTTASLREMLQRADIYLRKQRGLPESIPVHKRAAAPERSEAAASSQPDFKELAAPLCQLLLSGDARFLSAAAGLKHRILSWPASQHREALSQISTRLTASFDAAFPWVHLIEALSHHERSLYPFAADYTTCVHDLFDLSRLYELTAPPSLFYQLCAFVIQEVEHGVSLRAAAKACAISTDYAGRIFKQHTGVNFSAFVMSAKMERGKVLLTHSRSLNYEISNRLGYRNPDYFRQLFKAYTGLTPTEYRSVRQP